MATMEGSLGDAWVDVHARVDDDMDKQISSGLKKEAEEAEKGLDKIGTDFGEAIGESMEKELGGRGPEIAKSVEKAVSQQRIDFGPRWRWNRRGSNGRFIARMAGEIAEDVEEAFVAAAGGSGGFFNKITQGISDAIGAGFNVSGKSPLIALLVPVIGAIVGLVLAAIQAVNSLVAAVATLPALLMAVGLQAGVLFLAFKGLGTAIEGAFAADTAKELNEALKGLTPSAQKFVRSLLPLESLFKTLQAISQESFFRGLGDVVTRIAGALGPILTTGIRPLARELGELFRGIGLVFASPEFTSFFRELIPATVNWLARFGPALATFLTGMTAFSETMLPFLTDLGNLVSGTLLQLGVFFQNASNDPATTKWLDDMFTTFTSLVDLVSVLIEFIAVFMAQLNAAGGQQVIDTIIEGVERLTFLLASPAGRKALEGLVHFVIIALDVTMGLIMALVLLMAGVEVLFEWLRHTAGPFLASFFVALYQGILVTWGGIMELFDIVGGAILGFLGMIGDFFVKLWRGIVEKWNEFYLWFTTLPKRILGAVAGYGSLLFNAGRSLIQGLINGISNMLGALGNIMGSVAGKIASFLPGSPAEEGPLSGMGYSMLRGQRMVQDFARGMESEIPSLRETTNNVAGSMIFGANSIRVGFSGVVPTQRQAEDTGMAVASGIMGLAARDTRLAVRTL